MKPVDQLVIPDQAKGTGESLDGILGDCWRACIASMLELPAEEVPHFVNDNPRDWWTDTQVYLYEQTGGYIDNLAPVFPLEDEYTIAVGPSPRGDFYHAVIVHRDGSLAHDPHPSRDGLPSIADVHPIRGAER